MKILSIGLDNSIMDKNSSLAKRVVEYGDLVEKYTVVVPGEKDDNVKLSDKVDVYSAGGGVKFVKLVKLVKLVKSLLKKEKYDVITVQDQYYLGWVGLRLARKFELGLEIQVHGFEKYSGLRKLIAKRVISGADAVRTVSQRLRRELVSEFGVDEGKITVVPIFTDVAKVTGLPRRRSPYFASEAGSAPPRNDTVFLNVGRLVEVKNVGMQIKAMANDKLRMASVELWIVGDGPQISDFRFQISDLKLEEKVKLLGWQDDLSELYKQADVFLLTSNYEGWGLVVIEAAAHGLPIIMTDVGCAGEVIKGSEHAATNSVHANENKGGESGIVISVGDQKALEKAMVKLAGDAELRKRLGQGARKAVEQLPSKEETLKLYLKSWQKAMSRNK